MARFEGGEGGSMAERGWETVLTEGGDRETGSTEGVDKEAASLFSCVSHWPRAVIPSYLQKGSRLAQGRSPIFINGHWLRGVPPK